MDKIKNPYRFSAMVVLGSLILFAMSTGMYGHGWSRFIFWIVLLLTQTTGVFLFLDDFKKIGKILLFSLAGVHALNLLVSTIIIIAKAGSYGFHYRIVSNFFFLSLVVAVFVFLFLLMMRQKD